MLIDVQIGDRFVFYFDCMIASGLPLLKTVHVDDHVAPAILDKVEIEIEFES